MWIDDFLDSCINGLKGMDIKTLKPIIFLEIEPLYAKEWTEKILLIIRMQKKLNLPWKEIAFAMHSPSVVRIEMILTLINSKFALASFNERMQIGEFYKNVLSSVCLDDIFAMKNNLVHDKGKIKDITKKLIPANPLIAKKLGMLSNACYNLSYALYSDINPQICYENFGKYKVNNKMQ